MPDHQQFVNRLVYFIRKLRDLYILQCHAISAGLAVGVPAGFDDKMIPYALSKLGVTAMTRHLALLSSNNIMHKAFCPDGTDTDMIAEATKALDPKQVEEYKRTVGLMTPEFVAEGFFKLLTECGNGSVMLIQNNSPYILIPPDANKPLVLVMSRLSRLIGRLTSTDLVTGTHIIMVIMLVIIIFGALLMTIF